MPFQNLRLTDKVVRATLLGFLGLFILPKNIIADYIYLKDGSTISGIPMEEREKLLVYRVPYGEMFVNRENVSKIIKETKDMPLLREAERYLKDREFERAIKTCGEILEIKPNSIEALELKQKAIDQWRKYESEREGKIRKQKDEREQKTRELEGLEASLKTKCGIAIKEKSGTYVIADIYYNCPLNKGEIKPGDIIVSIQDTPVGGLSIKKIYELLSILKKISLTIRREITLTRENLSWQGRKEYVGFGISIEKEAANIKITNLMPDGPAAKAGLLKDDSIIQFEGSKTTTLSMDEIINIMKGIAGTGLKIVVEREIVLE